MAYGCGRSVQVVQPGASGFAAAAGPSSTSPERAFADVQSLDAHAHAVTALCWGRQPFQTSLASPCLASGDAGGYVIVWSVSGGRPTHLLSPATTPLAKFNNSADGTSAGGGPGAAEPATSRPRLSLSRLWGGMRSSLIADAKVPASTRPASARIRDMAWADGGSKGPGALFVLYSGGHLRFWQLHSEAGSSEGALGGASCLWSHQLGYGYTRLLCLDSSCNGRLWVYAPDGWTCQLNTQQNSAGILTNPSVKQRFRLQSSSSSGSSSGGGGGSAAGDLCSVLPAPGYDEFIIFVFLRRIFLFDTIRSKTVATAALATTRERTAGAHKSACLALPRNCQFAVFHAKPYVTLWKLIPPATDTGETASGFTHKPLFEAMQTFTLLSSIGSQLVGGLRSACLRPRAPALGAAEKLNKKSAIDICGVCASGAVVVWRAAEIEARRGTVETVTTWFRAAPPGVAAQFTASASPGPPRVAVADDKGCVHVVDLQNRRVLQTVAQAAGPGRKIKNLFWAGPGALIFTTSERVGGRAARFRNRIFALYTNSGRTVLLRSALDTENIKSAFLSPDARLLVLSFATGPAQLVDMKTALCRAGRGRFTFAADVATGAFLNFTEKISTATAFEAALGVTLSPGGAADDKNSASENKTSGKKRVVVPQWVFVSADAHGTVSMHGFAEGPVLFHFPPILTVSPPNRVTALAAKNRALLVGTASGRLMCIDLSMARKGPRPGSRAVKSRVRLGQKPIVSVGFSMSELHSRAVVMGEGGGVWVVDAMAGSAVCEVPPPNYFAIFSALHGAQPAGTPPAAWRGIGAKHAAWVAGGNEIALFCADKLIRIFDAGLARSNAPMQMAAMKSAEKLNGGEESTEKLKIESLLRANEARPVPSMTAVARILELALRVDMDGDRENKFRNDDNGLATLPSVLEPDDLEKYVIFSFDY